MWCVVTPNYYSNWKHWHRLDISSLPRHLPQHFPGNQPVGALSNLQTPCASMNTYMRLKYSQRFGPLQPKSHSSPTGTIGPSMFFKGGTAQNKNLTKCVRCACGFALPTSSNKQLSGFQILSYSARQKQKQHPHLASPA